MKKKKPTKKQFIAALRANDVTECFRLYKLAHGEINRVKLCEYLESIAPSDKLFWRAYKIAYFHNWTKPEYKGRHGYYKPLPRTAARLYLQENFSRPVDNYTKVAMYGYANLYAASPVYRHADYNKAILLPIAGNEKTCAALVKLFGAIKK